MNATTAVVEEGTSSASASLSLGKFSSWVAGNLRAQKGRAHRGYLRQVFTRGGEERSAVVMSYVLGPDPDPEEIAKKAWEDALEDAADLPGVCRYTFTLEDAEGAVLARRTFRIRGRHADTGEAQPEEPPTAEGLVALTMRHLEARGRTSLAESDLMFSAFERVFGNLQRQLDRAEARIDKQADRELKTFELYEQLASRAHERELAVMRERVSLELKTRTLEKLEPAIPAVLNRVLGKLGAAPASADGAYDAIDTLILSLTEEQANVLAGALTEPQRLAMLALFQDANSRAKKKQAKKDAAKAPSSGTTSPASGASATPKEGA